MIEPKRKRMKRVDELGTARYLTFSCYRKLPLFVNDQIKARFVADLITTSQQFGVRVIAWVIMPDHVHLIVFPREAEPLTGFLTALKRPIAMDAVKRWNAADAPILSRATDKRGAAHFWQAGGGFDRNLTDELLEKIGYIHRNPVRRQLTASSVDWPWSSARRYASLPDAIGPEIAFDLLPPWGSDLL